MTELIEQAAPQNAAWIIRGEPAANGRALRIELGPTDETAVAPGDWAVVVGSDDAVRIVGRILRVRSDTGGRTIYFDQALAVDPAVPLTALGLTAPSALATRLPWDDFLRVLPLLGAASPDAVPLIQDVTYVRDLLELSVRDDLLGPAGGPHELIKDMSVRDRYLVGKLAPRRPDDDQAARVEPASAAEEAGDLEDERAAPLHEPGAEFASASGRVEPEDDVLDEIDTTNNQSLVPSSLGLTFCVAPDMINKMSTDDGVPSWRGSSNTLFTSWTFLTESYVTKCSSVYGGKTRQRAAVKKYFDQGVSRWPHFF